MKFEDIHVQIPAYHDRWMMGDRFGHLVKVTRRTDKATHVAYDIAHVKLDKSKRTIKVLLDDCQLA